MNTITRRLSLAWMAAILMSLCSCGAASAKNEAADADSTTTSMTAENTTPDTTSATVKVETTLGTFTVLLYGDTPRHRDNFLKLVKEGYYDGVLFHRVIDEFMVQTGDPDSKDAKPGQRLGAGGPDYTLEAEIAFPRHFHKRGALAAARQGDQVNPERRSSGSQFYVVTGRKVSEAEISMLQRQLEQQQLQATFNSLAAPHMADVRRMQQQGDREGLQNLQNELVAQAEKIVAENPLKVTPEMAEAYTTVGGAPHLDGQYTVFGEVIDGMDVIDRIEKVETDSSDRPKEDIRIIKMTVVK